MYVNIKSNEINYKKLSLCLGVIMSCIERLEYSFDIYVINFK